MSRSRRLAPLVLALACLGGGCGMWRLKKYGLEAESTYGGGWMRYPDGQGGFRLDKIFPLDGVELPDRLFEPLPAGSGEGRHYPAFCSLLDSVRPGKQRYLVAYRHYLATASDTVNVTTFYALIRLEGDQADPRRSLVTFVGGEPPIYYPPRRIVMSPGPDLRILIEAGPSPESGDAAGESFLIEGRLDTAFRLADYHAHLDEMYRRNGEKPERFACPER
jgi:hypothetical protein